MAATACAYAFEGDRRPSPSPQVPEPPFDLDSRASVKPASSPPVPPPPPPVQRPSSIFSRNPGLCTEGLGSESSGDVDLDDAVNDDDVDNKHDDVQVQADQQGPSCDGQQRKPARICGKPFPPPISVIGAGGKPWLYLRPHRAHGRLVLREVRIPSQELLQARREDGRFKLHFAAPQPEEDDGEEDNNS